MSFGFSAGDFIGAINLTYKLVVALRESHDAGDEYRAAIDELGCYQSALIKVQHLEGKANVSRETFDAASHIVMQSMDMIRSYLEQTKKYDQALGRTGVSGGRQGFMKVRWTLYKSADMKKLRESLQRTNTGLQVLLQVAGLAAEQVPAENPSGASERDSLSQPIEPRTQHHKPLASSDSQAYGITAAGQSEQLPDPHASEILPPFLQDKAEIVTSNLFSFSSLSADQLRSMIFDQRSRELEIRALATLLRTLIKLGDYQLKKGDDPVFTRLLETICKDPEEDLEDSQACGPIKFKDAVGRKFVFPWALCKTWKGMEELIKQAFLHVDIIGPHVHQGYYDLVGPDGEIILPQVWETLIQPDWSITMHMWPMPEPPSHGPTTAIPPPPPPLSPTVIPSPLDPLQRAKQRGAKERPVTTKSKPRSVASASLQSGQKPHRNDHDKPKSSPSGFFAWATGGKTTGSKYVPSSSPSRPSTWNSHTPPRSSSSFASTHSIPASPGSEDHANLASADALTNDLPAQHASTSNDDPTEIAFESEGITGSMSSSSLQSVEFDERTACVELSSSLHEEPPSSSRNAAVDKADARARASEDTLIGDALSRPAERQLRT